MEQPGPANKTNESLPPRRTRHPSEKGKWLRAFYIGLVLLFVALTVGLMLWGKQLSLSGQTESESVKPGLFAVEVKRPGFCRELGICESCKSYQDQQNMAA